MNRDLVQDLNLDIDRLIDKAVIESMPDSFEFRKNQREIIFQILESFLTGESNDIILEAPTGTGKSIINVLVGQVINSIYGSNTLYVTKTIALQNQYTDEFPFMRSLKSASNYSCSTNFTLPIPLSQKNHPTCKYKKTDERCEYQQARIEWRKSSHRNLNYAFYLRCCDVESYNNNLTIIFDEAHELPNAMIDANQVTININRLLSIVDKYKESFYEPDELINLLNNIEELSVEMLGYFIKEFDPVFNYLVEKINKLNQQLDKLGENDLQVSQIIEMKLNPYLR